MKIWKQEKKNYLETRTNNKKIENFNTQKNKRKKVHPQIKKIETEIKKTLFSSFYLPKWKNMILITYFKNSYL